MKKMFIATTALTLFFLSCDKDEDEELNSVDRNFVRLASIGNNAEIQAGQLAVSKGTSQMVKDFGAHMVMEHGLAQTDLKNRAEDADMDVSDTVDAEHRALMTYLSSLNGYSFDTAYINS